MIVPEGESKQFLGQEFLTWLWFHGENNEWAVEFAPGDRVSYGLDEMLILEPEDTLNCSQKLSGPIPIKSPEAQIGLSAGKRVKTTRIVLVHKEHEWIFTCQGNTFHFSSLKLAKPESADPEDRFAELSYELEEVIKAFDRMYNYFLEIRLTDKWKEELDAIHEWIAKKS